MEVYNYYTNMAFQYFNTVNSYFCFIKLQRRPYIGQQAYVKTSLSFMKQSPGPKHVEWMIILRI